MSIDGGGAGEARRRRGRVLLLLGLFGIPGCQPNTTPTSETTIAAGDLNLPATDTGQAPLTEQRIVAEEYWDQMLIDEHPVGYQMTKVEPIDRDGSIFRKITVHSELQILRFGQSTHEIITTESIEDLTGQLVEFSTSMTSGQGTLETTGQRQGDRLSLSAGPTGQQQPWTIALPPECGGFHAVEWSLQTSPLHPGEQRELQALVPLLNSIARVELRAVGLEPTTLPTGQQDLLRVESRMTLAPGQAINSELWLDDQGRIIKSVVPAMRQTTYRVTREQALASLNQAEFDLGEFSVVRVAERIPFPHQTERIRYRVTLVDGDPAALFPNTPTQLVKRLGPNSAEIEVRRSGVDDPAQTIDEDSPTDADQQASPLVESADPTIVDLSHTMLPDDESPWALAFAIERRVHELISEKNFSSAFASAAEVARTREGDCTEHSVLLSALCRARGIPARSVVGLVYVASQQVFGFHMWNEVWIGDRWVPLDGTIGQGGIGAAHLTLARTPLSEEQSFSSFLPVMNVMGQLEIEVLDIEPSATPDTTSSETSP